MMMANSAERNSVEKSSTAFPAPVLSVWAPRTGVGAIPVDYREGTARRDGDSQSGAPRAMEIRNRRTGTPQLREPAIAFINLPSRIAGRPTKGE